MTEQIVSLRSSPAIVSEGGQLFFDFNLSQPASEGGLTTRLALLRDTDPAPGDIQYFVDGSTNITNFELIRSANGLITNALVTITEGATTARLVSNVIDDGVAEPEETVTYALAAGSGYEIDPNRNSANFTLTDFPVVSLSSEPAVVAEGDQLNFNFQLSKPTPANGLTVRLSLLQDTDPAPGDIQYFVDDSTNITDFQLIRGADGLITDALVTIAGGTTEAKLVSNIIDDGITEGPESATYALAAGNGYSIDPEVNKASFTLIDKLTGLPVVSFSSDQTQVSEGEEFTWKFSISQPVPAGGITLNLPITVSNDPAPGDINYFIEGSTNITAFDFIVESGVSIGYRATLAGGATEAKLVSRAVVDNIPEIDEFFTTVLAAGASYLVSPDVNQVSLTITDLPTAFNTSGSDLFMG